MKSFLEKIISYGIDFIDENYHMKNLSRHLKKYKLNDNSIIFDVGTHKGEYLKFFLKLNNKFTIFAFEPQKNIFEDLKKKYQDKTNINLNNIGLGEKKENLEMKINIKSSTSTFSKINLSSNYFKLKSKLLGKNLDEIFYRNEIIPIETIDNIFLNKNLDKIDLVKIDVLGFEYKVLKGAKKTLPKIKLILLEFHNHDMYPEYNLIETHEFLTKNNFSLSKTFKFPFMNWEDRLYVNNL